MTSSTVARWSDGGRVAFGLRVGVQDVDPERADLVLHEHEGAKKRDVRDLGEEELLVRDDDREATLSIEREELMEADQR